MGEEVGSDLIDILDSGDDRPEPVSTVVGNSNVRVEVIKFGAKSLRVSLLVGVDIVTTGHQVVIDEES